jgi:quercetin dioxygenase-like cupin family protein
VFVVEQVVSIWFNGEKHSSRQQEFRNTKKVLWSDDEGQQRHFSTRAAGTDLSISFLSQLECGKANISVENLKKITDFLDISMVRLFEIEERQRLGAVTRKGEGMVLKVEGSTAYCESLIRKSGPNLQATLYINPPGEGRKAPMSHIGEELVYVIRGELTYYLNDQEYHLREGDLMYYRSESLHSWYNPGKWENVIFVVNTPPNW